MSVRENLERVRERMALASERAGRDPSATSLLAVSKFHPAEAIRDAISAGQLLFGENRVQEALEKFPAILAETPLTELHIIGSLQRNKVAKIVDFASCVQSVDRLELLEEISLQSAKRSRVVSVLFELHTGEDSKSGFADEESLFKSIDALSRLPAVRCAGLMTMAPFTDDERAIRASFRRLAKTRDACQARYPSLDFSTLSMGMSADFEIAIEEGSTLVRVGTAIFGERQ